MKASPTMQQMVEQVVKQYAVDLTQIGVFLRLDLPQQESLVIDHIGQSQISVAICFEECGVWKIDREVIFFTGATAWIPLEITQQATGWTAFAKLDPTGQRIVRIDHCGQEKLAEFTEGWARKLLRQKWLEQSTPYQTWIPPTREET